MRLAEREPEHHPEHRARARPEFDPEHERFRDAEHDAERNRDRDAVRHAEPVDVPGLRLAHSVVGEDAAAGGPSTPSGPGRAPGPGSLARTGGEEGIALAVGAGALLVGVGVRTASKRRSGGSRSR